MRLSQKILITKLKNCFKTKKFLASAVTMPYKEKIVRFIKFGDKISKYSKSVNLIIKKNQIFLAITQT